MAVASLPAASLAVMPGTVLVRVRAVGVNPVETYIRSGKYHRPATDFPYTPGHDAAGVVEAVGEGVVKVKPGEDVWGGERGASSDSAAASWPGRA